MSCYVLDRHAIWYLAVACQRYLGLSSLSDPKELRNLAQILWQENVEAVTRRYRNTDPLPGPTGENFIIAQDEPVPRWRKEDLRPVQVIKAARCYLYQTDELPDTFMSRKFIRRLLEAAIEALPGYEEAVWGAPEPIQD